MAFGAAGLAPVNEIECFAVGFSDCRHSAGEAPIESQGPVRIDSLLERTLTVVEIRVWI